MPKIKRTDSAACDLPRLGHFEPGDEREVSEHIADHFRNTTGWTVIDEPAPATTTTTEPPESGDEPEEGEE